MCCAKSIDPQLPQKLPISTANFSEKPIAVRFKKEQYPFTGAAMLQKERANKALSARVWKEKSGSPQGTQEDTSQRESSQVIRTLVAGR
jgi:hypothetical protein